MSEPDPLLSLNLAVEYSGRPVLESVVLQLAQGEIVGLVGQSGSGKSTLALSILRLLEFRGGRATGHVRFRGRDLLRLKPRDMRQIRGREIGLVLQSPLSSLNPALKLRVQLAESWRAHASRSNGFRERLQELMERVSLPADDSFLERYPHQISVGQAQRVLIAMAVLHRPALLIADEPTSALDVITQSEILRLFAELNRTMRMGILYISHDLLSVATLCHRIAILHEGRIAECARTRQIFTNPQDPYTKRLIESLPRTGFLEAS